MSLLLGAVLVFLLVWGALGIYVGRRYQWPVLQGFLLGACGGIGGLGLLSYRLRNDPTQVLHGAAHSGPALWTVPVASLLRVLHLASGFAAAGGHVLLHAMLLRTALLHDYAGFVHWTAQPDLGTRLLSYSMGALLLSFWGVSLYAAFRDKQLTARAEWVGWLLIGNFIAAFMFASRWRARAALLSAIASQ